MTLPATPDRFPQPDPVMSVQLPSRSLSRAHLGLLLGFIGMAIFGGSLPATRVAVTAIDPLAVTALRSAVAGMLRPTGMYPSLRVIPVIHRSWLNEFAQST